MSKAISIKSKNGKKVTILTYGAIIQKFEVPHKGGIRDIVLGYNNIEDYKKDTNTCLGATIGRHAGRINNSTFTLNGKTYNLAPNNGKAHLHGSFHSVEWSVKEESEDSLTLTYLSPDMEDGMPGNLSVDLRFYFEDEVFVIHYSALSDKDTIFSPTNHSYFNLDGKDTILDHSLVIEADSFFEADDTICRTGRILPTEGTGLDFRKEKSLRVIENPTCKHLLIGRGLDHAYLFKDKSTASLKADGLVLRIESDERAMQVYTAGYIASTTIPDKNGKRFKTHAGICFETQRYEENEAYPTIKAKNKWESFTKWYIFEEG